MAVFPGCIYSQLPQYHDGRAPAWEEPRDERMVGVHVTVAVTMLIGKFLSWGG